MNRNSGFISPGRSQARKAIENWAKEEIQAIENSALGDSEKAQAIEQMEAEKQEKLKKLNDPHILWSRNPPPNLR